MLNFTINANLPIRRHMVISPPMNEHLMYGKNDCRSILNDWGKSNRDFFFFISYDSQKNILLPLEQQNSHLFFSFPGKSKLPQNPEKHILPTPIVFEPVPPGFEQYEHVFSSVMRYLKGGVSSLINLTFPSGIKTNLDLEHFFLHAHAPFKVLYRNKSKGFTCFSPEKFINISNNEISTFPMKGTIPSEIPNAEKRLINDKKESEEHQAIVELMKNDLSSFAHDVSVKKYRYIDRVTTSGGDILQTSSEITGHLNSNWNHYIGELLMSLSPAGSIAGSPKQKSLEIINECEIYDRGFYSGVFGYYSNKTLYSAVAIRFIEQIDNSYIYKSGGGITAKSSCEKEYKELIEKIYVPFMV